jgi:hypothetical protein
VLALATLTKGAEMETETPEAPEIEELPVDPETELPDEDLPEEPPEESPREPQPEEAGGAGAGDPFSERRTAQ